MAKKPVPAAEPDAPTEAGYTVLARRYRPQTFREIVGQTNVAQVLSNAIKGNRVAHAYLFTGARGVGKTSTARILAKALNCVNGPTDAPCGECDFCKGITSGDDVDVLEIDGASTRGIDDVREIRGNVQYRPSRARFKIYIIDEVHMLTRDAFNALLKTLEEPPSHVKFIFATTDVQKIPVTILSRCQRFDFPSISTEQIVGRLREIVALEKMQADDEALELIARRATGSMRDAQSLLDQLLAFGAERLTTDQVHHLLGTAGDERILALAGAILSQDPSRALALLEEAANGGLLLSELVEQLISYWRDLMVLNCAGKEAQNLSMAARFRDGLYAQAKAHSLDTILAGLDILAATRERLRGCNHGRTLVEMALVRLGRLKELASLAQLARMLDQPGRATLTKTVTSGESPASGSVGEALKKKPLTPIAERPAEVCLLELTADTLPNIWSQTIQTIGVLLASEWQKANLPAIFGPNTLAISFPSAYNQARDHCQRPSSVARVQEVLRKLTGREWLVRIEAAMVAEAGPANEEQPETRPSPSPRPRRSSREEVEKEPLLQRAVEVLGAQVMRVDDGFGTSATVSIVAPETLPDEEV